MRRSLFQVSSMRILKPPSSDLRDRIAVVNSFLEDSRRLIEAGKGRRWEVFKWAMTLQIVVVSLSLTANRTGLSPWLPVLLSWFVTFLALGLIRNYSDRMDGARDRAIECVKWLRLHVLDINAVTKQKEDENHPAQDRAEQMAFTIILLVASMLSNLGFLNLRF